MQKKRPFFIFPWGIFAWIVALKNYSLECKRWQRIKKKLMCHMASRETEKQKREENCVKSMGSVLWHQNLDVHTRLYILPIAPYRKILLQSNISRIKGRKKIQEWWEKERDTERHLTYWPASSSSSSSSFSLTLMPSMCDCRLCAIGNKHYWRMYQFTTVKVHPIHAQSMNSSFSFTTHSDSAHIAMAKKKLDK